MSAALPFPRDEPPSPVPDVAALAADLDRDGHALIPGLLDAGACAALRAMYDDPAARFRSTIDMARYRFGRGQYRYFGYPLPAPVAALRAALYPPLAVVANAWQARLAEETRFPATHAEFIARCRDAGQHRPTCLLLRYRAGDHNCLHQDLYGEVVFPLQVIVQLSEPGRDFDGGELVLVEQRPRAQSRPHVVAPRQGDAVVIATHHLPREGTRGTYRAALRHGVATVTRGERMTLGLVMHDSR